MFTAVVLAIPSLLQTPCPAWSDTFEVPGANASVACLQAFDDGSGLQIYAGGAFTRIGGIESRGLARWDGATWSQVGGELNAGGSVAAFAVFDDGSGTKLHVVGNFTSIGGVAFASAARWDGVAWSSLGSGLNGFATSAAVFDEGSGPALFVGGSFTMAGGIAVSRIARWAGGVWTDVGGGVSMGDIDALAPFVDATGPKLYATGSFRRAGTLSALRIARWDGTQWRRVQSGLDGRGRALATFDDGSGPALYVGGDFQEAGGVFARRIARWNGSAWSDVGGGVPGITTGYHVGALHVSDDGSGPALFAGGTFTAIGTAQATGAARWDGVAWTALGSGLGGYGPGSDRSARAFARFDIGASPTIVVAGSFSSAGGFDALHIALWRASGWSRIGPSIALSSSVTALATFEDAAGSALFATGGFRFAGDVALNGIARWDGAAWSTLGAGIASPGVGRALCVHDEGSVRSLFVGGDFTTAGGAVANHVARWDGGAWHAVGGGTNEPVLALAVYDDGNGPALYAGGEFTVAGGSPASHVAKWDGVAWSPLGSGTNFNYVSALASYDAGGGAELYAGGWFNNAGGVLAYHIARWNGSAWSNVGNHTSFVVRALEVFDDGTGPALYVGGEFDLAGGMTANGIARWNGSTWSPLAAGLGRVESLAVFDEGNGPRLFAGGAFQGATGSALRRIARWDGGTWTALDEGLSTTGTYSSTDAYALCVFDDRMDGAPDLYVGGYFPDASGIMSQHIAIWRGCSAPAPVVCPGDGSGAACPCGNSGATGRGCASSVDPAGGLLANSGHASITNDTLVLAGSGMPDAAALYFQGTSALGGGSGATFGDGLRCAGGTVLRLATKLNVAGASSYPEPMEASVSTAGAVPASGGERVYQAWYRNAADFCTTSTFNLTNGLSVAWSP